MFLFFCISLIKSAAVPRFSYLIANDMSHRQCENLSKIYEDYFEEGGYKTQCKKSEDECKQIAKAFEDFLCVDEEENLDHCLEEVDDDTELLIIDALKSEDTFNFQKLEHKMAVQMFGTQISSHHSSILNSIKQHNLEHNNENMNTNPIKIQGSMRKKVSTLSVFNQGQLSITSPLDVPNAFFCHCSFASKLESSQKVSLDPDTYNNLITNKNGFKLKHINILLPDIKSGTIRISFSNDSINFLYSNQNFPSDPQNYKPLIDESVHLSSFEKNLIISITSLAKYYSLYLDDSFDPNQHKLPNFTISIDEISDTGSRDLIDILATENVEIKTESANENAWSQFTTQPHIGVSLDNTQYSVNAPSSIAVDVTNPNSNPTSPSNNNKTVLIVVLTVVIVVIIIVIIVVVVIIKKKKAAKNQAIALDLSTDSGRKGSLLAANEEEKLTNSDDEKAKEVEQHNNQPVQTQHDPENPQAIYPTNQSDDSDHNTPVPQYPSPYPQSTEQFPESPYGNPIHQNNTPF